MVERSKELIKKDFIVNLKCIIDKTIIAAMSATCPVLPVDKKRFPVTVKKKNDKKNFSFNEYKDEKSLFKRSIEEKAKNTL
jgi:hypothetical protein